MSLSRSFLYGIVKPPVNIGGIQTQPRKKDPTVFANMYVFSKCGDLPGKRRERKIYKGIED